MTAAGVMLAASGTRRPAHRYGDLRMLTGGICSASRYFALVRENNKTENEILAQQKSGEQLLVKLRGQVYQIE